MSDNNEWDIDKYKEEHECEEHWQLRKAFMQRWSNNFPEERLVCLARVFANIELLGCRYPTQIMQEIGKLSEEVAQAYRESRKGKLQRTFVSASDAAEDRAKGIKRKGGVVVGAPATKSAKILFVPQGEVKHEVIETVELQDSDDEVQILNDSNTKDGHNANNKGSPEVTNNEKISDVNEYLKDMEKVECIDVRRFDDSMFWSEHGRLVLLVRPWAGKLWNIQTSCQVCKVACEVAFEDRTFSLRLGGKLVASATGACRAEARAAVETMAWNRLREEVVSVVVKQQWIPHGDAEVSVGDVSGGRSNARGEFGAPVESGVAAKMMKLMGWKGGGLGADAQGIEEPIQPQFQMVNRSGLGSTATSSDQLRRSGQQLMRRYLASDVLDLDLVFSSEFSKEERAQLHQCAQKMGLASRSYGDKDRFLVVKKKLDPFSLARAVVEKGGSTPKYQIFVPARLARRPADPRSSNVYIQSLRQ